MKWTRQQYIDLLTFKNSDRQMFVELVGLLIGLEDEWSAQGASEDELVGLLNPPQTTAKNGIIKQKRRG